MSTLLGFRLAVAGGREGRARLVLTAVGVGIGVTLLLVALAAQSALQARDERRAWQNTDGTYRFMNTEGRGGQAPITAEAPDAALWLGVDDAYGGTPLFRIHIAPLGPRPPVPPGLDRLPADGELAVSPALRRLLADTPDDQLDDRLPGRVTTTIGPAGLVHPDQLLAVVGHTPQELRDIGGAQEVRGISTRANDVYGVLARLIVGAGAIMLLVPVVVFIVMVTRVAAAQRERRFAAIRLAGATRLQTAILAAVETGLGAAAGIVAGRLGFLVARPVMTEHLTYQGGRFFAADLAVPPYQLALVLAGLPVLAMLVTVVSLHRAQVTPLGISRQARRRPPTAWQALPLVAGAVGLAGAAAQRDDFVLAKEIGLGAAVNVSLLCVLVGVVLAGPWMCLLAGRVLARGARRTTTLMAARRIAADPRAAFRAVSGVLLAVFVATFFAGLINEFRARAPGSFDGGLRPGVVEVYAGAQASGAELAPLISDGVVVVRYERPFDGDFVVPCAELTRVVNTSSPCPLRTGYGDGSTAGLAPNAGLVEPGADVADLPVHALYLPTDGSVAAEERARTRAAAVMPRAIVNTPHDRLAEDARQWADLNTVVRLVTWFIVVVAGCGLTVSVISGLIERRRPFALLRASGVRLGELRRMVMLETAVPMVSAALLGGGLGLAASYAFWRIEARPWPAPGLDLALGLGGGLLAALAVTTVALPLLGVMTRYDAIRHE